MSRFNSEEQVMGALGIDNLQSLSQDKMQKFVSMIPDMDRKVAVGMVSQFPSFDQFATDVISQLNRTCDRILGSNDASQRESIEAYKSILNCLQKQVESEGLSFENKQAVIEQMLIIADHIAQKDSENKLFLDQIHKRNVAMGIGMGVLVLGALALGVAGIAIYVSDRKERDLLDSDDVSDEPIDISVQLDEPHVYLDENSLLSTFGSVSTVSSSSSPWDGIRG